MFILYACVCSQTKKEKYCKKAKHEMWIFRQIVFILYAVVCRQTREAKTFKKAKHEIVRCGCLDNLYSYCMHASVVKLEKY